MRWSAFEKAAREAVEAHGLTPLNNFITIAPTTDQMIVRAWVVPGKSFIKLYADVELVRLSDIAYKQVYDVLRIDLQRCQPIHVRDL